MAFPKASSESSSSQNTSLNTPATLGYFAPEDVHLAPPSAHRHSAYKTRPCRFFAKGRCTAGEACRWSHDESLIGQEDITNELPDDDYLAPGYKLVPKSYRTQPCARFLSGHCYYGDQCNFIHSTSAQASPTPSPSGQILLQNNTGSSPPQLMMKAHSTQHSPAISSLHAPGIRSSISAATPSASTVGAPSSAPTRPRELPPPPSQSHLSGIDWSVPTPATPSKNGTSTPPIFASSPLITASQPPLSRSNSIGLSGPDLRLPASATPGMNGTSQANLPSQMRSPFLFTFGEIGPGSAMNSPRGLGLNGANLAPVGSTTSASPSLVSSRLVASPTSARIASPSLGGSALGTTGINVVRQKSRLSTSTDVYPEEDHENEITDAETEPDFPSISYSTLGDLVTEPDEELEGPLHRDSDFVGLPMTNGVTRSGYATPNGHLYRDGPASVTNGAFGHSFAMPPLGLPTSPTYHEREWGIALSALHGETRLPAFGPQPANGLYHETRMGYKMRPCKFYIAGSKCPAGQNCTFLHDPEALRRPSAGQYVPNPIPPEMHPLYRTRECKYHLAGQCHQGETCAFKHTGPPGQGREYENWEGFSIQVNEREIPAEDKSAFRLRPCKWFLKGNCFHGENCTYSHSNPYSRPQCIFFRGGSGHCMNGDDCRFSHDVYSEDGASQADQRPEHDFGDALQYESAGPNETAFLAHAPPLISTTLAEDDDVGPPPQQQRFNEPYFGGVDSMDRLPVQDNRMELVVSEGEDEEEDEDIVVLRRTGPKAGDPTSQDVEKLFASSPAL